MEKYDIVIHNKKMVQIIDWHSDNGVVIQDIHTKTEIVHKNLITKASTNDVKWFCENTEHINFVTPKQRIR